MPTDREAYQRRKYKAGQPPPPQVKRRCLGPGREHLFWSDGVGSRVCGACRVKLRGVNPELRVSSGGES